MTNSEDIVFYSKERKMMEMDHLVLDDNQYDHVGSSQGPEFDSYGTALNEL
ncbi:MAG: hypothetical protein Q8935_13580 [Bacillota bacterium]|nr:hypothetical protein [Bacillota bacterium]MDP4157274.1 hypothetical protein [Bacillota bacterium]